MAFPTTNAELSAFILTVMQEQQTAQAAAGVTGGPPPLPGAPDTTAEIWRARDAANRAENAVEMLRQHEHTMAETEEEVRTQLAGMRGQVTSMREKMDQEVLDAAKKMQEFQELITTEMIKQEEAAEALIKQAEVETDWSQRGSQREREGGERQGALIGRRLHRLSLLLLGHLLGVRLQLADVAKACARCHAR